MATALSTTGLIMDTLGALLLFFFLREVQLIDMEAYLQRGSSQLVLDASPKHVARYKRGRSLSRLGIALLMAGFLVQVLGNFV